MTTGDHEPRSARALVEAVRFFHSRGWCPATSSNFSYRPEEGERFWISQSGVDKGDFGVEHLMEVEATGAPVPSETRKPSAETGLHAMLYAIRPELRAVLHVHAPYSVVYSRFWEGHERVVINGWELQKGIAGTSSHEVEISIPVFSNSQDIKGLAEAIAPKLTSGYAFLLGGHGLYAYGNSVAEAKRHVEVVEALLEHEHLWRSTQR